MCLTLTGEYSTSPFDFTSVKSLSGDLKSFIDKHMQGEKNAANELKYAILNSYSILSMIMREYIQAHYSTQESTAISLTGESIIPGFYQDSTTISGAWDI